MVGVVGEPEPEPHAGHPRDDRQGSRAGSQPPVLVPPDAVGHAAEDAEDDAGRGQDADQGQVVAAERDRPQVDDAGDARAGSAAAAPRGG